MNVYPYLNANLFVSFLSDSVNPVSATRSLLSWKQESEKGDQSHVPAKSLDTVRYSQCKMGRIILELILSGASAAGIVTHFRNMGRGMAYIHSRMKFSLCEKQWWESWCIEKTSCPVPANQYCLFTPSFYALYCKSQDMIIIEVVAVFSCSLEVTWKPQFC